MSDDPERERAQARIGSVLKDKWRLDALLGVGGMGAVYAATHRNKMRVAVKMLHAELCGNDSIRTRFLREGYLANTVDHPGSVSVLDDDIAEDGSAFLVMELLDGETVESRMQRHGGALETREAMAIGDKLLDVLAAAHDKGIVHRDIKPENLFLTRAGTLKVLDFGIARIFESSREKTGTRAGTVMGTPAFMAPEQALANWDAVDGRTDIWAVGATMFTMLTGRHVHEGKTGNEKLIKSATVPAPSLATVAAFPPPLVQLIDRALAFKREDRWPDARTAREALRAAFAEMKGAQSKPGPVPRASLPEPAEVTAQGPSSEASVSSVDPVALKAELAARTAEREARAADLARIQPAYNEVKERLAAAHRKVADLQERVTALRNEPWLTRARSAPSSPPRVRRWPAWAAPAGRGRTTSRSARRLSWPTTLRR
jgi:eukaryotic-like serine/threonine-protein kinase